MRFDTASFWIGSPFLPGLINCDESGLTVDECRALDRFDHDAHSVYGLGHWSQTGDHDEFGRCEVTSLRGRVERVEWVYR